MRFVHDIIGFMTVGGGGKPYALAKGQKIAEGYQGNLMFLTESGQHPLVGEEVIEIEGDAAFMLRALREAVAVLEGCGELMVEHGNLAADWQEKPERLRKVYRRKPKARAARKKAKKA